MKLSSKAPKISINIPSYFVVQVDDYHEFDYIQHMLKTTLGLNCKFEEVGHDIKYRAIFWIGKKPTSFIKAMEKSLEDNE